MKTKIDVNGKKQNLAYYFAGSVSLITFLVYLTTLRNGFVYWDDDEYVLANPHIRSMAFCLLQMGIS